MNFIIRGKKLITVSELGTIENGAMIIEDEIISAVDTWEKLKKKYPTVPGYHFSNKVITPSLVDCHTHLLEFAPTSLYPVTPETHFIAGKAILLDALSSGITALGEQICGHPLCDFSF
jgi:cytosine/adenosine deaminase-related metal-dependent hydrolase